MLGGGGGSLSLVTSLLVDSFAAHLNGQRILGFADAIAHTTSLSPSGPHDKGATLVQKVYH